MVLDSKKNRNTVVAYLKGRLDIPQVEEIKEEVIKFLESEKSSHFILNLRGVDYVSSAGIGMFVDIMDILNKRGKKFGICDLTSPVKRIMEIVDLGALFHIFTDENEAFDFLNREC